MKIIRNDVVRNAATQSSPRTEKGKAGAFDAMLHAAIEEKKASQAAPAQSLSTVAGPLPIDTATFLGMDKGRIVDGAEKLLGILEEFQSKLSDERVSLSDLSPIVERMDHEKTLLTPFLDTLPQSDPLKDVLNRMLIACSVEAEKFKRGDYL